MSCGLHCAALARLYWLRPSFVRAFSLCQCFSQCLSNHFLGRHTPRVAPAGEARLRDGPGIGVDVEPVDPNRGRSEEPPGLRSRRISDYDLGYLGRQPFLAENRSEAMHGGQVVGTI